MVPNIRVSTDARDLILNCCSGKFSNNLLCFGARDKSFLFDAVNLMNSFITSGDRARVYSLVMGDTGT